MGARGHAGEGKRRWLAYGAVGCVSSRAEEDHAVVEVTFHDTARHRKRMPLLTDFYRFSMAALSEQARAHACMPPARCRHAKPAGERRSQHEPHHALGAVPSL